MQASATIPGTRTAAEATAAEALLRRSLIACGADEATLQDQIDCADLALALGHADAARLIYEGMFLTAGFSPRQQHEQARIAARTGLWGDWKAPEVSPNTGFALDVATGELRGLVALEPSLPPIAAPTMDAATLEAMPLPITNLLGEAERPAVDAAAVADLSARLIDALRTADAAILGDVLDRVRAEILTPPRPELGDHAGGPIVDLAAAVTRIRLRAFFRLNHDLCWAPFGSAALFAATAQLHEAALGPYLTGVGRLLRSSRDLFGMLQLAGAGTGLERWLVLLSTHLSQDDRVGLADEMGDRGMTIGLRGLLASTRRNRARGTYLFWVIRDAGLDTRDVALAAEAQAAITELSRGQAREWTVLAEVLGTGGANGLAERALQEALRLAPLDELALERLETLRAGGFERFHIHNGFSSPHWRTALRSRSDAVAEPEAAVEAVP